jgi:hypothetical protein
VKAADKADVGRVRFSRASRPTGIRDPRIHWNYNSAVAAHLGVTLGYSVDLGSEPSGVRHVTKTSRLKLVAPGMNRFARFELAAAPAAGA